MALSRFRYRSPFCMNILSGIVVAFTSGIYLCLVLLGAGGGQEDSLALSTRLLAITNSIWVLSSALGSVVLHTIGPGPCAAIGVSGYILYVGGLWYFGKTDVTTFPYIAAVIFGICAGLNFVANGYIMLCYPQEKEKGSFITVNSGLMAMGSVIGGIIPLLIDRNVDSEGGVPESVYIAFIVIMFCTMICACFLQPPNKITRDDGTKVADIKYRGLYVELKENIKSFKDRRFLMLIPCYFVSETYLVFLGSTNVWRNNLRTRCLSSFIAVVLQIPFSVGLQQILDWPGWKRKKRALLGLAYVAVPLWAAWIWEIIRVKDWDRANPPTPMDWTDDGFAADFVLFILNWVSSTLWQYLVLYYLGTMTNDPYTSSHYGGGFRSGLAAGEAFFFGIDSLEIPFIREAGTIFALYAFGTLIFAYLGFYEVQDTMYFKEEHVVVPLEVMNKMRPDVVLDGEDPGIEPIEVLKKD
ncbi:hypothetical protein PV04_09967 [Phialophora macrospora]|uniref:Uncharacterized protein n=1 Tax=Phialophora macrospora TaxID=1851006 RepID=A0A0D2F860_9EURO|nr:hypothetical protein PV04_09967 [Phialophora macrospora]